MSKMTDKENTKVKIKAIYPHIVVGGDIDKPCYTIHWYDIEQKTMICGFGSYKLELVRKWLKEEFEVVERDIDGLLNRQQAEIERLRKGWKADVIETQNIKAEAIKEFAERLKADINKTWYYELENDTHNARALKRVDELVKKMVGDDK